ncbi:MULTISPECIES: HoxN/HupN/NixA family nickel/cobalt transporter [unclassified Janthinobacterium]|uniref:HoxN/HupN/NixA family nickel/cobalt transporter n=1 Tax=unclassified Janthinobacterium TaxID=2610881 RepID=UPI00036AA94A|nr:MULTISPECIES: hypothetical protein [unclassified Janthinobacterium]MEC5162174.1 high-affinity nickel-transport protein [Janthinobacterium sp. CG_S6]
MENGFLSAMLMMFVLGMRHGLDPDHVAMIDAMTFRCSTQRPRTAPWIGTLFATGHGLTVTAIAVGLSFLTSDLQFPPSFTALLDWLPVVLLLVVGTLNLRALLIPGPYQAVGWKRYFVPRRLQDSSHPFAIFSVGVVFALVFDTATQAAVWGYAATSSSGAYMALAAGLAFTVGMVLTDTLDGRLMYRMLQRSAHGADAQRYRRCVAWAVVILAFGVALYSIAARYYPSIELTDTVFTIAGLCMSALLLFAYWWTASKKLTFD